MKNPLFMLGLTGLLAAITHRAQAQEIHFPDFRDLSTLTLRGDAAEFGNPIVHQGQYAVRLTNADWQSGSVFTTEPVMLPEDGSFSTAFAFQIHDVEGFAADQEGPGADGFVFSIQSSPREQLPQGGDLGYKGTPNSVAIEVDTWNNGADDQNLTDHLGINLNGSVASVVRARPQTSLNSGDVHYLWIDYLGASGVLEVRHAIESARPAQAILSHSVDLIATLGGRSAYVGFASGSGAGSGDHDIRSWTLQMGGEVVTEIPLPDPLPDDGFVQLSLTNPDFELPGQSVNTLDDVEGWDNVGRRPSAVRSPSPTNVALVVSRGSIARQETTHQLAGNAMYRVRAQARTQSGGITRAAMAVVDTSTGNPIASRVVNATRSFSENTLEFYVPADSPHVGQSIGIQFEELTNLAAYIDDVSLSFKPLNETQTRIPLVNPDFEQPGDRKIKDQWQQIPGWDGVGTRDCGVEDLYGTYSAFLNGGCGTFQLVGDALDADTTYTLIFEGRRSFEGEEIRAAFYTPAIFGGVGQGSIIASKIFDVHDGLTEYQFQFTASSSSASVGKPFGIFFENAGNVGSWVHVDNVQLFQTGGDSEPTVKPPVAATDTASTAQGENVLINVLENDSHPDNESLTLTSISQPPANGTAMIEDNQVRYTPNTDFLGEDTFTYTVAGEKGGSAQGEVTVTIMQQAVVPIAMIDEATVAEDSSTLIDVLANDSHPNNAILTLTSFALMPISGGMAVIEENAIRYTPPPNLHGDDFFIYEVQDAQGNVAQAQVNVTVTPVNDDPEAGTDEAELLEDGQTVIAVLINDRDPDGDALTVSAIIEEPGKGDALITGDTIRYFADPNVNGTDQFSYEITDGNGGSASGTVTLTIIPVNDPPRTTPDAATGKQDQPITLTVLDNDFDLDRDDLTISEISQPPANGVAVIERKNIIYTPNAGFSGEDTFSYRVNDGQSESLPTEVTITIEEGEPADLPSVLIESVRRLTAETVQLTFRVNQAGPWNFEIQQSEDLRIDSWISIPDLTPASSETGLRWTAEFPVNAELGESFFRVAVTH